MVITFSIDSIYVFSLWTDRHLLSFKIASLVAIILALLCFQKSKRIMCILPSWWWWHITLQLPRLQITVCFFKYHLGRKLFRCLQRRTITLNWALKKNQEDTADGIKLLFVYDITKHKSKSSSRWVKITTGYSSEKEACNTTLTLFITSILWLQKCSASVSSIFWITTRTTCCHL